MTHDRWARDRIVQLIAGDQPAPRPEGPRIAARAQAPSWRQTRCDAITQRCHAVRGDRFGFVPYTLSHFGQAELMALTDAELEQTFQHVMRG
jgi:hypothetical protein